MDFCSFFGHTISSTILDAKASLLDDLCIYAMDFCSFFSHTISSTILDAKASLLDDLCIYAMDFCSFFSHTISSTILICCFRCKKRKLNLSCKRSYWRASFIVKSFASSAKKRKLKLSNKGSYWSASFIVNFVCFFVERI
ncbi:uncharacterized protein LOC129885103 isoform X1 [Solanum dulcamara]|uniref:uncharacterized protein LOC129885103 isoform X1 n=1 Tax=Solanum dulcamara TaxID=45834 RepID=UPI0024852DC1|nr:uncharacterized protein LOC129885103 isoform X1 [Solanum dulcamara]